MENHNKNNNNGNNNQSTKDWDHTPATTEKISDLIFSWEYYPRKDIDYRVVHRYAKAIKAGSIFPPIKIGLLDGKKIIVDGVHRMRSREFLDLAEIECITLPFKSKAELFAETIRWNNIHGRPFSSHEVRANIKRLKDFKFGVNEIVSLVHVPASEIYREAAAPVYSLTSPSGKIISPGRPRDSPTLVEFKNAVKLCLRWANSGMIPMENAEAASLVVQGHLAFGRVLANA